MVGGRLSELHAGRGLRQQLGYHWLAYQRIAPFAFVLALIGWTAVRPLDLAFDVHAYWAAAQTAHPYSITTPGQVDAYLYSPAFVQIISPIGLLPWPVFAFVWSLILGAAALAMTREWAPLLLLVPFVSSEFGSGNIHFLLAAVLVFGMRRPGIWAFALLTKPTLGICLLWFVARREWSKLAEALATTALVAGVSALLSPALWGEWIGLLLHAASGASPSSWMILLSWPLWARLTIAAAITLAAARWNRPVLLPVAAIFALPVMWLMGASMLVACIPLLAEVRPDAVLVAGLTERAGRVEPAATAGLPMLVGPGAVVVEIPVVRAVVHDAEPIDPGRNPEPYRDVQPAAAIDPDRRGRVHRICQRLVRIARVV